MYLARLRKRDHPVVIAVGQTTVLWGGPGKEWEGDTLECYSSAFNYALSIQQLSACAIHMSATFLESLVLWSIWLVSLLPSVGSDLFLLCL